MRIEPAFPIRIDEIKMLLERPTTAADARTVGAITTDSRAVRPGDLFVALRGDTADGHAYLEEARNRGAVLLFSEIPTEGGITVSDTREALRRLAGDYHAKHRIPTVAITGSVGKTGTKDAVAAALSPKYSVHKTEGNQNNELGTSYTLLSRPKDAELLVLELGTNHPGEIAAHSKAVRPDIAIITAIGSAHIGAFGSREAILAEKAAITRGMHGGYLILNRDDPYLASLQAPFPISYVGLNEKATFFAEQITYSAGRCTYMIKMEGKRHPITLGAWGRPCVYASLFAMATAHILGVPEKEAALKLAEMPYANGRQTVESLAGITLIDDSYNSSPEAVEEAILLLSTLKADGNRHIVLGDMLELGIHSASLHEHIGECAAKEASFLYAFGEYSDAVARGAKKGGMPPSAIVCFPDAAPVPSALIPRLAPGDAVLIKASHSLHGNRIAAAIRKSREFLPK